MFWHSRGSGRRLESVYTVPNLKIISQLGKRCQWGLLGLGFAPGLVGLGFSWKKQGIIGNTIHLYLFSFFSVVRGGRGGWMA